MRDFEEQGGIAFLLIYYSKRNFYYYLPFKQLSWFWDRAQTGGRKSFRFEELDLENEIPCKNNLFIHYLENIAKDIECREPDQ